MLLNIKAIFFYFLNLFFLLEIRISTIVTQIKMLKNVTFLYNVVAESGLLRYGVVFG